MTLAESSAARLNLRDFIARNEMVKFERLWSIKAAAASRDGKVVEPVLCRVVGAYRHFVGELPVWGPASVALKLTGGGRFDSRTVDMRETTGETIDRPMILGPEQAAQNIARQLETLMGQSKSISTRRRRSIGYALAIYPGQSAKRKVCWRRSISCRSRSAIS